MGGGTGGRAGFVVEVTRGGCHEAFNASEEDEPALTERFGRTGAETVAGASFGMLVAPSAFDAEIVCASEAPEEVNDSPRKRGPIGFGGNGGFGFGFSTSTGG